MTESLQLCETADIDRVVFQLSSPQNSNIRESTSNGSGTTDCLDGTTFCTSKSSFSVVSRRESRSCLCLTSNSVTGVCDSPGLTDASDIGVLEVLSTVFETFLFFSYSIIAPTLAV